MNFKEAIALAAELAYEQDADQIVASEDMNRFSVFHNEDPEAMTFRHTVRVYSDGVLASDLAQMLERAGIDGDQDWEYGKTIWTLPCGTLAITGSSLVEFA